MAEIDFAVRRISIDKVYRNHRGQIASQDADRIANFIAAALKGETEFNGAGEDAALCPKASPGDFLILTRTSGYLSAYAQALEERGIPFDITGGQSPGRSRCVARAHRLLGSDLHARQSAAIARLFAGRPGGRR